jgi:hypothetical protein
MNKKFFLSYSIDHIDGFLSDQYVMIYNNEKLNSLITSGPPGTQLIVYLPIEEQPSPLPIYIKFFKLIEAIFNCIPDHKFKFYKRYTRKAGKFQYQYIEKYISSDLKQQFEQFIDENQIELNRETTISMGDQ